MITPKILFAVLLFASGANSVREVVDLAEEPKERVEPFGAAQGNRSKRQASALDHPKNIWEGIGTLFPGVNYFFDPSTSPEGTAAMRQAIAFYEANTCIQFNDIGVQSVARWQLRFIAGPVCYAQLGKKFLAISGTPENSTLGPECENMTAMSRLMGRILNLLNAQSRHDRDDWLWVDLDNVVEEHKDQFIKSSVAENNNYGFRYDYRSIMHDTPAAFAIDNSKPVMVAYDPNYQMAIGASHVPTFTDIAQLNNLYACNECAASGTECARGGYPHPKNCSQCLCPSGFGGDDCSQRQAPSHDLTCGETIAAEVGWMTFAQKKVCGNGLNATGDVTNPSLCTYHIEAPKGHRVEFYVDFIGYDDINDALCRAQCSAGGLDLKGHDKDFRPEGYRLCCSAQLGQAFHTVGNLLVIQAFNNFRYTDFQITYRIDPCGADLTATPQFQWLTSNNVVGDGRHETADRNNPKTCTWTIEAPADSKLIYAVNFVGFDGNRSALCHWNCWYGAVEVQGDHTLQFCCPNQNSQLVRNEGNKLTLKVTNIFRFTEFNFRYAIDSCADATTVCLNGGVPDPGNCGKCECRPGFIGEDCSMRATPTGGMPWSCGTTHLATDYWQWLERKHVVGFGSWWPLNPNNPARCTYIIEAPEGKRIEYAMNYVGFDGNENGLCTPNCENGGVVVRGHNAFWHPEGENFCCHNDYNTLRTSGTNLLVLQVSNSLRYTDFQIAYHVV